MAFLFFSFAKNMECNMQSTSRRSRLVIIIDWLFFVPAQEWWAGTFYLCRLCRLQLVPFVSRSLLFVAFVACVLFVFKFVPIVWVVLFLCIIDVENVFHVSHLWYLCLLCRLRQHTYFENNMSAQKCVAIEFNPSHCPFLSHVGFFRNLRSIVIRITKKLIVT